MEPIIHYYLEEIRDQIPGDGSLIYENLTRILDNYGIESEIPTEYQVLLSKKRAGQTNRWFDVLETDSSKTPSAAIRLRKTKAKLETKLAVKAQAEFLKQRITTRDPFQPKYSEYLFILRAMRVTLCDPRQWDDLTKPIDLDLARNSVDLSYLELLIAYWQYIREAPDTFKMIYETPLLWPTLFRGAGGGVNMALMKWNLDDVYYCIGRLTVALRTDYLELNKNEQNIRKFQLFCHAILFRVAQLAILAVEGDPVGVSPLMPTLYQSLASGVDKEAMTRERRSAVSEEVRKHIKEQNILALKQTFGDDYEEQLEQDKIGNTRMKSKEERTGDALLLYNRARLQDLEEQMELIQGELRDLLKDRPYEECKEEEKQGVKELAKEYTQMEMQKKEIKEKMLQKTKEEEEEKRLLLKRIHEDSPSAPEEKGERTCGMTRAGLRETMIAFDQIQFKIIPSLVVSTEWPSPVLPLSKLLSIREKLYNIVITSVLNVNEDNLLSMAHDWILNHLILTMSQKVNFMVKKNKSKKIKAIEIWKYLTPSDKSPSGERRIPNWIENITELLSPSEKNVLHKEALAFACDYWLSQHMGKSLPTQRGVFLWDLEERLWDLKMSLKEFPYIGRIGSRWVLMFNWDYFCDAGERCEDAVIRWMWEVQKRNWVVIDRVTGRRVSLRGTSIYNTFKDLFN